ncbi:MAG: hypothetical protein WCE82_09965 [Halobacteriota archaeon]
MKASLLQQENLDVYIDFSSILLFILGIIYLVLLPGYLILVGLKVRDLDVIETLVTSFGIGVGVLTAISVALSLTGSVGLTASTLVPANAAVLVALCLALVYVRHKRGT